MSNSKDVSKQYLDLGQPLVMTGGNDDPIQILAPRLHLVSRDDRVHSVSLTFQVDPGSYAQIVNHSEYNLSPEVREEMDGPPFDGETLITIETRLNPQFLFLFEPYRMELAPAGDFLLSLDKAEPDHPLRQAANWLATQVSQRGPNHTSQYRTLWHRLNISATTIEKFEKGAFNEEIREFLRKKIGVDFALLPDQFTPEAVDTLIGEVGQLITGGLKELFAVLPTQIYADTESEFETSDEEIRSPIKRAIAFLSEDGWNFELSPDEQSIVTGAKGDNGDFICQIIWEPVNDYLICYTIIPVETVPVRLSSMLEFIARANFGLPSGNFEMNLETGEIRFRSSLFAANRYLSYDEIEDLLYTAVLQTDLYLPGILQVNNGVSPVEAIAVVENASSA